MNWIKTLLCQKELKKVNEDLDKFIAGAEKKMTEKDTEISRLNALLDDKIEYIKKVVESENALAKKVKELTAKVLDLQGVDEKGNHTRPQLIPYKEYIKTFRQLHESRLKLRRLKDYIRRWVTRADETLADFAENERKLNKKKSFKK